MTKRFYKLPLLQLTFMGQKDWYLKIKKLSGIGPSSRKGLCDKVNKIFELTLFSYWSMEWSSFLSPRKKFQHVTTCTVYILCLDVFMYVLCLNLIVISHIFFSKAH